MHAPVGKTTLFTSPNLSYSSSGSRIGHLVLPRIRLGSFKSSRAAPTLYAFSLLTPWYMISQPRSVLMGGTPAPIFNASYFLSGLRRSVCLSILVSDLPSPNHMLGLSVPYADPIQALGLRSEK